MSRLPRSMWSAQKRVTPERHTASQCDESLDGSSYFDLLARFYLAIVTARLQSGEFMVNRPTRERELSETTLGLDDSHREGFSAIIMTVGFHVIPAMESEVSLRNADQ